ncbi:MAG: metallophosphoesterase family protein [Dehalococcoidales bacterium]
MRIGLLSDTHIPSVEKELPSMITSALAGVDLILHGGDIYTLSVLDDLEKIAPVLAARGDDDYGATITDERVKGKHILQLEGKTLWLVHEKPYVPTSGSWLAEWWKSRLNPEQDEYGKPDIVVFGHEHRTFNQYIDGALFINPGSPTFLKYVRGPGTIGILDINGDTIEARIVELE